MIDIKNGKEKINYDYVISEMEYAEKERRRKIASIISSAWSYMFDKPIYDYLHTDGFPKLKDHNESEPDPIKCMSVCLKEIWKTLGE